MSSTSYTQCGRIRRYERGNLTASKLDYLTFQKVKLNRRKRNDTQAPQPGFILLTGTQTLVWRLVEHHILALFRIYCRSRTSSEGSYCNTRLSSTAAHSCLNEPPYPRTLTHLKLFRNTLGVVLAVMNSQLVSEFS